MRICNTSEFCVRVRVTTSKCLHCALPPPTAKERDLTLLWEGPLPSCLAQRDSKISLQKAEQCSND